MTLREDPNHAAGFTAEQIADWRRYEEVRQGGEYNMLDANARLLTGLSGGRYKFCLMNYSALRAAAEETKS